MPYYNFTCPKCGHKMEIKLAISDRDSDQECPECKHVLKRDIEAVSIHGLSKNPLFESNDQWSKNELADALKEHDKYRREEDKINSDLYKAGEFVTD